MALSVKPRIVSKLGWVCLALIATVGLDCGSHAAGPTSGAGGEVQPTERVARSPSMTEAIRLMAA